MPTSPPGTDCNLWLRLLVGPRGGPTSQPTLEMERSPLAWAWLTQNLSKTVQIWALSKKTGTYFLRRCEAVEPNWSARGPLAGTTIAHSASRENQARRNDQWQGEQEARWHTGDNGSDPNPIQFRFNKAEWKSEPSPPPARCRQARLTCPRRAQNCRHCRSCKTGRSVRRTGAWRDERKARSRSGANDCDTSPDRFRSERG